MMARLSYSVFFSLSCLSVSVIAYAAPPDFRCSQSGTTITCSLSEPVVNQARYEYHSVIFQPNDKVVVQAGGCVQTGGHGLTWKRYVDPQGPNSDRLYHGLITIPGITGPSLVRIQGIVGKTLQIPATIDPKNNFLVLGYEDDGYGDNGYTAHDNGTGDQCKDAVAGKPAWVTIQITRGGATGGGGGGGTAPSPLDLVWTNVDPGYIPLNPEWAYEKAHGGQHPDTATLCGGFAYSNTVSGGVSFGSPPCTSQSPISNFPGSWSLNSALCSDKAQSGHLDGHLNWMAATFSGIIQWDNHKDWTKMDDDDYNFNFFPDTVTGLTADNITNFHYSMIETEFDSDETVDLIDKGWWDTFHKAVDSNGGEPGGRAGQMIDSHRTIITGLFGLDSEHGAYSELHPVWGMAIEVQEGVPSDDQWSFLVRNWGNEGYCSQDSETLPVNTMSFFIPMPGATGVTANTSELYQTHASGGTAYNPSVSITSQPGGAVITFDLGPPSAKTLVNGLVHFAWTMPAGQTKPVTKAPIKVTLAPPRTETSGPGVAAMTLFTALPADKQAQVKAKMVKPAQATTPNQSLRRVPSIAVARRTGATRSQRVANPRKSSLDLIRGQALCSAYNGKIPNAPNTLCTSLK